LRFGALEGGKIMKRSIAAAISAVIVFGSTFGTAGAADLGGGASAAALAEGGRMCVVMPRSRILDLSSASDMEREVDRRYQHAVEVAADKSTIGSRSPRWIWSNEAKVACGKAVGYFAGREINEEMISKCDCFHGRMLAFMR
jgi:hypothetical protein